jgi:hypothetical protein
MLTLDGETMREWICIPIKEVAIHLLAPVSNSFFVKKPYSKAPDLEGHRVGRWRDRGNKVSHAIDWHDFVKQPIEGLNR